jgi:putative proteasome-type protease
MTYCLGMITRYGLVMAADSLTHAGVDYISNYQKLFDFSQPGERVILISTAGNLSMSQGILTLLHKDLKVQSEVSLHTLPTMYDIACYIGQKSRQILDQNRAWLQQDKIDFQCSFILAGQIRGDEPCLFLIYSQGNCLQATPETPFLQIGETKYGKPIIDRTLTYETSLEDAAKCALLSIDSTMKSNISVGPPINIIMYPRDTYHIRHRLQFPIGDPYLVKVRKHWEGTLRKAFEHMPPMEWIPTENLSASLLPAAPAAIAPPTGS